MKQQIKIFLGAALLTFIALGYLALSNGHADTLSQPQAQQTPRQTDDVKRTVQVSGMGEMQVQPDSATIELGVQTDEKTAQAALNQNSKDTQALIDALKKAQIPAKDIQTQTLRLTPRYEFDNTNNTSHLVGYTASNIVEVHTQALDSLGSLLDNAVKAGANTIENISFEVSNSDQLVDQVRQTAVENARHKAEQLAKLTGATLGSVSEIQETSNTPAPVPLAPSASSAAQNVAVPISPGTQSITVQVQITWTLVVSNSP